MIAPWRFERLDVPWVRFLAQQVFFTALALGGTTADIPTTMPSIATTESTHRDVRR